MAVFKADNLKNEIFSVTKAQDFIVADPEYDNKTIDAYVNDSFLNPEMRGNRAFSISASVYNYKNFSMNNVKATLIFDNPEDIEFIEDFYPADVTKSIEKIYGRKKENFNWEIRVKDGVDISSVGYTIEVTADEYDKFVHHRYIDTENHNKLYIDTNISNSPSNTLIKIVDIHIKSYSAKKIHVVLSDFNNKIIEDKIFDLTDSFTEVFSYETRLSQTCFLTVVADEGTLNEQIAQKTILILTDSLYDDHIFNRQAVAKYAELWAEKKYFEGNPEYYYYSQDCANFVSQCLRAGGVKMNPDWYSVKVMIPGNLKWLLLYSKYWYDWDITENWRLATSQYKYFSNPYNRYIDGEVIEITQENYKNILENNIFKVGDLMYFAPVSGADVGHATIITKVDEKDIYYSGHTNSRYNKSVRDFFDNNEQEFYHVAYIVQLKSVG